MKGASLFPKDKNIQYSVLYIVNGVTLFICTKTASEPMGLACPVSPQRFTKVRQILERYLKLFMFPIYILRGAICKQRETYVWKVVIFHDPLYASTECGMAAITSL